MKVSISRIDVISEESVDVEEGETFLGRGPLLKIDATNVSRKHVRLNISNDSVLLTCVHRNSIFVKKSSEPSWSDLAEGKTKELESGDEFKFLEDKFHFKLIIDGAGNRKVEDEEPMPEAVTPEKEKKTIVKNDVDITPKPTGLKSDKKKRKLPDWMLEASSAGESPSKKPCQERTESEPKKVKSSEDLYMENAKFVNSALTQSSKETKSEDVESIEKSEDDSCSLLDTKQDEDSPLQEMAAPKPKTEVKAPVDNDEDKENRAAPEPASSKPVKPPRKSCPYGASCYRKNPVHRVEEAHPGDDDYKDPAEDDGEDEDEDKPECEYGMDCYRKNPQHRKQFKHTRRPQKKRAAKANVKYSFMYGDRLVYKHLDLGHHSYKKCFKTRLDGNRWFQEKG